MQTLPLGIISGNTFCHRNIENSCGLCLGPRHGLRLLQRECKRFVKQKCQRVLLTIKFRSLIPRKNVPPRRNVIGSRKLGKERPRFEFLYFRSDFSISQCTNLFRASSSSSRLPRPKSLRPRTHRIQESFGGPIVSSLAP